MVKKILLIIPVICFVIYAVTGGPLLRPIFYRVENKINAQRTERAIKEHTDNAKVSLQALEQIFKDNQENFVIISTPNYIVVDDMKPIQSQTDDFFYIEAKIKPVFPLEELFKNISSELETTYQKRKITFGKHASFQSKEEMINVFGDLEKLKKTIEILTKSQCYEFVKIENCLMLTYFTKDKVNLCINSSFCGSTMFEYPFYDFGFKAGICDLDGFFELKYPTFRWDFDNERVVEFIQSPPE